MKSPNQPAPGQPFGQAFRARKSASVDHAPSGKLPATRPAPAKPTNQVPPPGHYPQS
jgi:hypothetical protein